MNFTHLDYNTIVLKWCNLQWWLILIYIYIYIQMWIRQRIIFGIYWTYILILTHWGRVTHIWISKLTIIGSDNGLSPGRRQAITWTNVGILLIGPLGTNFSEMLIEIHTISFKKIHLKMSSGKWRPFCLGLNVLTGICTKYSSYLPYLPIVIPGSSCQHCATLL